MILVELCGGPTVKASLISHTLPIEVVKEMCEKHFNTLSPWKILSIRIIDSINEN